MANFINSDKTGGRAPLDAVCLPYYYPEKAYKARLIVEYGSGNLLSFGMILSHELGHLIGMNHNRGWGNKFGHTDIELCKSYTDIQTNGEHSIMRRLEPDTRRVWSICNRCDLLKSYQKHMKKFGKYCMQENVSNLGGSEPTNPGENPVTTPKINPGT